MRHWRRYSKLLFALLVAVAVGTLTLVVYPRYRVHDTRDISNLTIADIAAEPYVARAHCRNCDWEGRVLVPTGQLMMAVLCPRCRTWLPGMRLGDGQPASTLVSPGTWELLKASPAAAQ